MTDAYWLRFLNDGEAPDEMNTQLIGPLPYPAEGEADPRVLERVDPGALILEPESFDDWYAHEIEMERED
jgi:hypothetical protein